MVTCDGIVERETNLYVTVAVAAAEAVVFVVGDDDYNDGDYVPHVADVFAVREIVGGAMAESQDDGGFDFVKVLFFGIRGTTVVPEFLE